ncbi:hypothetical protein DNH61_07790 [Paenibacillus sambharensis]|uniref:Phage tail protein n=1 Tax=Paenibacillus sambharensis TaxID=1803190 RepID=A0A2W1LBY7_9BACL|nr:hypothetical protein [Paenibacillus sambharensis]PZD96403.1 hypothetical protein DNH61_07790 [Paenibacillus sambharensis]
MQTNFGRIVEVTVSGMTFSMEHYALGGVIPFDNDMMPNESEIRVWNLAPDTIQKIKINDPLTVNAGYHGDIGLILHGFVSSVQTRPEGADKVTIIHVMDSEDLSSRKVQDTSFKAGTLASYMIRELASRIKMPIAQFDLVQDYRYMDGYTASGEVTEVISKIAADCKTGVYINKGKLYVRNLGWGKHEVFKLSSQTGLLGIPEWSAGTGEKSCRITCQLQYRISTASAVELKSQYVSGRLYVKSGSHKFSRTGDFTTEVEAVENEKS